MIALTRRHISLAVRDIEAGLLDWRLWNLLGWQDVKQRYRRSTLGPLWLTLSTAVQMLVMGMLGSFLFSAHYERFLPFVCAGIVFWTLFTSVINDGANAFVNSTSHLLQIRRAFTTFLMQTVWRNCIILGHNFVIYVAIAIWFLVKPSPSIVLWPLGLFLDVVCISWMALVAGIVSARFRDIPMIIQTLFNVLFWLTPLMYFPSQLGPHEYIIEFNPFAHMLALAREPLLGQTPTLLNWGVVLGVAVLGWGATFLFFARFRARIVYWL